MTQGHFEVAKFHGTYVSIFDSHWFAEKIIATAGKEFMCAVIAKNTGLFLPRGVVPCMHCRASMLPYRDFMAAHRKENTDEQQYFIDRMFDLPEYAGTVVEFRLEAARRMLAAYPIRYCLPFKVWLT